MKHNKQKKSGFVIASELVFVLTIGVIGMVVGFTTLQGVLNEEYSDIAGAIGATNQSYSGMGALATDAGGLIVSTTGSTWTDRSDGFDDNADGVASDEIIFLPPVPEAPAGP